MHFILKFIYLFILNLKLFETYELSASNKTTLFNDYYQSLLNNQNVTNQSNTIKLVNSSNNSNNNTIDLIKLIGRHKYLYLLQINGYNNYFPNAELNLKEYCKYGNNYLKDLKILDFSSNGLKKLTLLNQTFCRFQNLRYVDLSNNELTSLTQLSFEVFSNDTIGIKIEAIKLDHNEINFIQFSTFEKFSNLKYLDLSFNKLKYMHPATLNLNYNLELLDLSNNRIEQVYKQNYQNLKYLYLSSDNINLTCDCLLNGLYEKYKLNKIFIDDFKCKSSDNQLVKFKSLNEIELNKNCEQYNANISFKIDSALEKSTVYSYLAKLALRWFTWYVWPEDTITDVLPKIPFLLDDYDNNTVEKIINLTAYRFTTVNITCEALSNETLKESVIIWKTPFGYFAREANLFTFHKMSNLTLIHKHMRLNSGPPPISGSNSINEIYINNQNELILTKFRQIFTGKFTCFALNPNNYDSITFNINTRVGVSDYFFYCLLVSIISSIIPSIVGIILCIICEKQALDSFPMTPPVFPTPLDTLPTTPPNFDFNQWMSNTASNIQGTLDQASKKLRKGLEKASTTVKSIGVTSTAYFYSVYEQSTQRLNTIKSYKLPTLPNVSLPTMRYSNQIVTRMGRLRTGMADVFLQFREFCGSSDLTHTASIATIESDTNASNAVGFIVCKIPQIDRSMNFIAEETNLNEQQEAGDEININTNIDEIKIEKV